MKIRITHKEVNGNKEEEYNAEHIEFCKYDEYLTLKLNGVHHVSYCQDIVIDIEFLSI